MAYRLRKHQCHSSYPPGNAEMLDHAPYTPFGCSSPNTALMLLNSSGWLLRQRSRVAVGG